MKALFVCNQGMHRSRTAASLFSDKFETQSAGLFNNIVTSAQLHWADIVFVMEEHQRRELSMIYPKEYMQKKILVLDIPDIYRRDQPELIEKLTLSLRNLEPEIQLPHG